MIAIYIACFLLALYYLYVKNYSYWKSRGVPFEKPFFIFGSIYNVAARKQHLVHRIREIYEKSKDPYVGIYILNQPILVVQSPKLIKSILIKDFEKFRNRQFASNEAADPLAAHSLFSAKDQAWRSIRSKITPVFTSGKLKLMFPLMVECGKNLKSFLENCDGQVVEVRNTTKKYAVDIISSCAFGINSNCLQKNSSEVMSAATKLADFNSVWRSFSIFSYFFAPKLVDIFKLQFLDKTSSDFLINMLNDTIDERKKKKIQRNDLIDLLNNLVDKESFNNTFKFDKIKLASQAVTFFSAGNDTTSVTISFVLFELALNQPIQSRLRKELQKIFEIHGEFSYEAIQELKYLDMIINETLRKYPITGFLNRQSESQYTFEETGFILEKGVSIMVPISGLHFDPEYFPEPEKFDPERFSDENKHKIVPFTYLPFGDGPRNCIGQRFGVLVAKVAIAFTIKDFVVERCAETKVPIEFNNAAFFLDVKNGINLKVRKV